MPHLRRYPGIQLHDLDEARTVLTKHLAHHRIEVVGKSKFLYGIVTVPLDLIAVSRVFSPTPRRIYTGFDDRYYIVSLWNQGAAEHLVNGRKFSVGPGQGMVYAPSCETLSVPGNPVSMDAIVIRIPAEFVRAEASLLLGPMEIEKPFEITGTFDTQCRFWRVAEYLLNEIDAPDGCMQQSSLTSHRLQRSLISAMIEDTPNNYRELIEKTRDSASAIIRKCKTYMMSCLPQPHRFSVKEMALEAGVVRRTIEQTFQKTLGKTPNRVWCDMKLEEARWYLEHPTAKIRLTRVAEYCGFRNLSRFAISYKQRFGEYPVETLQRGKSRHLTSI